MSMRGLRMACTEKGDPVFNHGSRYLSVRQFLLAGLILANLQYLLGEVGTTTRTESEKSRILTRYDNSHESGVLRKLAAERSVFPRGIRFKVGSRKLRATGNVNSKGEVELLTAVKATLTSDPLGALKSWGANDSDACGWTGVTCSQRSKHIVSLNLSNLQLRGTISPQLGNLQFLQLLDLSNNFLTGSIPDSLANCSNLSYLNASINLLQGEIPTQIGELLNLQTLNFRNNKLTGVIPGTLGNCTFLRHLDLGVNFVQGHIPRQLGNLSGLELLQLDQNSLSGSFPDALANCSSLTYLNVTRNSNLQGQLSFQPSQLNRLQVLDAQNCYFHGVFPLWIANSTDLRRFAVSGNGFHGEIPDLFGQLASLEHLAFAGNFFTGGIPVSISNCTKLIYLAVFQNQLTGQIPRELGLLKNLEVFLFDSNNFTGVIPSSLSNCSGLRALSAGPNTLLDDQAIPGWIPSMSNLEVIVLREINLQGPILVELGYLSKLTSLQLSVNNLTGSIPRSLRNCTSLVYLEMYWNQLTGDIPSELGSLLQLIDLQVSYNYLKGSFPALVFNLTQLKSLSLQHNDLSGNLEGDFGRLQHLVLVSINHNDFSGPIPKGLGNLSDLDIIDFGRNRLGGLIPPSIGNLTKLRGLFLNDNQLQGPIPWDMIGCFQLEILNLERNRLEGILSLDIGRLSNLRFLGFEANNLTGILPDSLRNCTGMVALTANKNRFIGIIPGDAFSKMNGLLQLWLSDNALSGSFPPQLADLRGLQSVNISMNKLSGPLPPNLRGWRDLMYLDLSFNKLTGRIPKDLALLSKLKLFNASYNNFDGPIPRFDAFDGNITEASFLGNPLLCGSILIHQQCPSLRTGTSCRGFKRNRIWMPVTCSIILVFICVGWVLFYGNRDSQPRLVEMATFTSNMRFRERDVNATIAGPPENIIGVGAKSIVYKGTLDGGKMFALKVLHHQEIEEDVQGDQNRNEMELLHKEVHFLAKLRHRNIVKVLGFFSTLDVKCLMLEYMPQGTLHKHLHEGEVCELNWETRFKIVMGVAHGMVYLHHDFPEPIIHRDLQPRNILLDTDLEPKICDFGISKFANPQKGEATASTLCGTIGYMAPEYATSTTISTKGDVYSYGVTLLEVLTRRKVAPSIDNFGPSGSIVGWIIESFQDAPYELLDCTLMSSNITAKEQMMLTMQVGLLCTRVVPDDRPSMMDVFGMLMQIKEIGTDPINHRTIEDLATEITIWTPEAHNDAITSSLS